MKKIVFPLSLTLFLLTIFASVFVHQFSLQGQAASPLSVSTEQLESAATRKAAPERSVYDEGANATGIVRVQIVVGKSGYPSEVNAIDGPESLRDEAETAAWQWHFDANRLSNQPRNVKGELTFEFPANK